VPDVDVYCVVGSKLALGVWTVDVTHIPSNCNPLTALVAGLYPGAKCNADLCAIPCKPTMGDQCNTVRVADDKDVDFGFAPVLGVPEGSTGSVVSAACKGACGGLAPNPLNNLLEYLTPAQHQVSLGTNSKSKGSGSCLSAPASSTGSGTWIPVGLSSDYDLTDVNPPSLHDPVERARDLAGGPGQGGVRPADHRGPEAAQQRQEGDHLHDRR
jgi:hypothetical protein